MTDRQDWQQPQYGQQGYPQQYPQGQQWQPQQYDPYARQQTAVSPQAQPQQSWPQANGRHAPQAAVAQRKGLTAAQSFWYVLMCIPMGAGYLAKVPAKKALQDFGMAQMTTAEQFWYVLMCIAFGGGYWAKIPVKKALSEMAYPGA
jgi:hypothetical protein